IELDAKGAPYEAYGYHPRRPGDTPIPFWGDHYIWTGKPRTPWFHLKDLMNREIFLKRAGDKLIDGQLHWSGKDRAKLICPTYHRHLTETYEAIWATIEAIRQTANQGGFVPRRWTPKGKDLQAIDRRARNLSPFV